MLRHSRSVRLFRLGTVLCLAIGAAACGLSPPPPLPAAANPAARIPVEHYRPVITGSGRAEPAEPAPWQDSNRDVAPPSGKSDKP